MGQPVSLSDSESFESDEASEDDHGPEVPLAQIMEELLSFSENDRVRFLESQRERVIPEELNELEREIINLINLDNRRRTG